MHPHDPLFSMLHEQFLLPIIRLNDAERCRGLCQSLKKTGFRLIEITLTTPEAMDIIQSLSREGVRVGAGTVLTPARADKAIEAGAQYLISPGLSLEIAHLSKQANIPYIPGVYTPSEVMQAQAHGLSLLKLFPAMPGGLDYFKNLKGPFPLLDWLPTGGIEFSELPAYMKAGATAVGQGTRLVSKSHLETQNWQAIEAELMEIQVQLKTWKSQYL